MEKAKGELCRDGDMIYFTDGKDVFRAHKTDIADCRTGYLMGRWVISISQWEGYAKAFGIGQKAA